MSVQKTSPQLLARQLSSDNLRCVYAYNRIKCRFMFMFFRNDTFVGSSGSESGAKTLYNKLK